MWSGIVQFDPGRGVERTRAALTVVFCAMALCAVGCWSQGGDGRPFRDGGPAVATRVDASVSEVGVDGGSIAVTDAGGSGSGGGGSEDGGAGNGCGNGQGCGSEDGGAVDTRDAGGEGGGANDGGGGGSEGTFVCGDIVGCASHCNNVASCRMQCRSYAAASEQAKYDTLYYCITVHGCTDVTCGFAFCSTEITACRANGKSCSAVLQCADTCLDDACEQACISTGTPYAQQLIDMIRQCGLQHGCSEATCLWSSCRPQVEACLAI